MKEITFGLFKAAIQKQFREMSVQDHLFTVDVDKDDMWETYLNSFPEGTNELYVTRREYDCSCCRHFVKSAGNIVSIDDDGVHTIWDVDMSGSQFESVAKSMSEYVKSRAVSNVFVTKENRIGVDRNHGVTADGKVRVFEHFCVDVPKKFVEPRRSIGDVQGDFRASKNVFVRSLEEITTESVETVLELISQNSLYRGLEWKHVLETFLKYKKAYEKISDPVEKELYAWRYSTVCGEAVSRIRNHSIGTLLVNISENMDLDEAVRKYEQIVAPSNYKRPKAIFTKRMLEDAQKTVEELGLMDSLPRRFATLDDVTANNILFCNRDSAKRIRGANPLEEMREDVAVNPKKFSRVESIKAEDFVKNVLPAASEVELLMENSHARNMVSLVAPAIKGSKSMFKWNNSFGWAYTGNIADSDIRENVKSAGGKVDGVLRFSIQWNDEAEYNPNDFDAHCVQPNNHEIAFYSMFDEKTGGHLDVDNTHPSYGKVAVENITWPSVKEMARGEYVFFVNCYYNRGGRGGFRAEIEFEGQVYQFDYPHELRNGENVEVARVTFDGHSFKIKETLPSNMTCRDVWGLKTNQFVPVSMICYSPNYWDEQNGIGNRHYFFMLKGCKNPERPNGMFNEYLREDLMKHKRVFEALGAKMRVEDSEDQLSGVGFCATRRANVIVKVKGATERILKVEI